MTNDGSCNATQKKFHAIVCWVFNENTIWIVWCAFHFEPNTKVLSWLSNWIVQWDTRHVRSFTKNSDAFRFDDFSKDN